MKSAGGGGVSLCREKRKRAQKAWRKCAKEGGGMREQNRRGKLCRGMGGRKTADGQREGKDPGFRLYEEWASGGVCAGFGRSEVFLGEKGNGGR